MLSDIKAKSGDRIPFCLEAIDNDEVSGGKASRTQTLVLEVFSARKQHRELLNRQDQFLDLLIDHLAGHIAGEVGSKQPTFNLVADEQKLLAEGLTVVSTMSQLLKDLKTDEYADALLVQALEDMSSRYPGRLAERSAIIGKRTTIGEPERDRLLAVRLKYRTDLENDILYIDKLIKKQRVDDLMSESDDLYKARADMASLIEQYRRTGDPLLLDQLQKKMAELQSAFQSLARRMAEMRKELPEEFINADGLDKANMMNLADEMEKLRQMLVDGDVDSAMKMADQFLSQMGQWMSAMEKSAGDLGQSMSAETMKKLSDVGNRLDDMIKRQQGVEDELQDIYQRELKQQASDAELKRIKGEIEQALKSYQQALNEGQQNFNALQPTDKGKPTGFNEQQNQQRAAQQQQYDTLRQLADAARRALADNDLKRAEEIGQQMQTMQEAARKNLEAMQPQMKLGTPQRAAQTRQADDRAKNALADAMAKLKSLQGTLAQGMDPASRKQLDELSRLQEELRSDVQQTQSDYEGLRAQVPSLPAGVSQSMNQAAFKMHDASGEMELGEPGRALPQAAGARGDLEAAAQGMAQARKQMQQGMGSMGGGMGMGMGMSGSGHSSGSNSGQMSNERVQIPDKDAYKGPEQYREELLRAMREGSPEAYKNLNRDYYERLVR